MDREAYNSAPIVQASGRVWFLNNSLVRKHHFNRAGGIMSVFNIEKQQIESCLIADFKRNRKRAYTISQTATLVCRHPRHLQRLMSQGKIPVPTGASLNGERKWGLWSYYSEDQVREIRDILSSFHTGRPRKDGLITNDATPTIQELTRRMGDGILTYTKTPNGDFVPLWTESI